MATPQRKIFISYRHDDHPEFARRIRDWLIHEYGTENIFLDVFSIPPMVRWADFIQKEIQQCDALLVIIGPRWLEILQNKEANSEEDNMREEIELGLHSNKLVRSISILDAHLPKKNDVPIALRPLFDYQVAHLDSADDFAVIIKPVIAALERELAIIDDRRRAEDFFRKGNAKKNYQQFEEALADYTEAIKINPDYIDAYHNRTDIYEMRGDFSDAIGDYNVLARLTPNDPTVYFSRAWAWDFIGDEFVENGIADYIKAIDLNPKYASAYRERGQLRFRQKQFQQAIEDYSEFIRLEPTDINAILFRAQIFFMQGKYDLALSDYKQANCLQPALPAALTGLSVTYYMLQQKSEAKRLWKIIALIEPKTLDPDWIDNTSPWSKPLIIAAHQLIAELDK